MDTALPRVRRFAVSTRTFRRLSLTSAVMLVVIVASGATVRMTGSGLGCEHWPGCQAGDPFPKTGYHSYVEFSNRIVASFAIIATLATFLASLLAPGVQRWARWVAGLAFVGTFLQAPLGAITVYYKLNPWLVGSHFLLSIVVLTLGVLVALEAWNVRGEPVSLGAPRPRAGRRRRLRRADPLGDHRDRRGPALGRSRGATGLVVPAGGVRARSRDRGVRDHLRAARHPPRLARQPASPRGARRARAY